MRPLYSLDGGGPAYIDGRYIDVTLHTGNYQLYVYWDSHSTVTLGTGQTYVVGGVEVINATIGSRATLLSTDYLSGNGTTTLNLNGSGSFDFNSMSDFEGFSTINAGQNEFLTFKGTSWVPQLTINAASGGADTFAFHATAFGSYLINNFISNGSNHDYIQLDQAVLNQGGTEISQSEWINQNVSPAGGNWTIQDGNNTIIVVGHKFVPGQDIVFV
jgi:hypothetical protein